MAERAEEHHTRPRARRRHASVSTLARDVALLGLIWGASVVLQRAAVAEVEPFSLVGLRLVAGLAFFIPFMPRVRRGLLADPRRLLDVVALGTMNPVTTGVLSAVALSFASSGLFAVLTSLTPLLTALLGRWVVGERPLTRPQIGGLVIAFGGVVVLIATRSTGLGIESAGDVRGPILSIVVAAVMAFATLFSRRRLAGTDALAMAAGQLGGGLLVVAPVALVFGGPVVLSEVSVWAWLAIVLSGTVGLGAAFVLFLGMVERHGPTAALLSLYVIPVAAMLLGAGLLGEQVTTPMLVGAVLVLGGVILFTRR
jgi:drug/metabolite transporter (DMT)-like permease